MEKQFPPLEFQWTIKILLRNLEKVCNVKFDGCGSKMTRRGCGIKGFSLKFTSGVVMTFQIGLYVVPVMWLFFLLNNTEL